MNSGIYKWTSPSGKSYIGQAVNLKKRKREFKRPNSIYTSKGSAIDNARAKYKDFEDEWNYEVLEECEIDKLDERETYWIGLYDTKEKGYNSTLGGDGNKGWKPSAEQVGQYNLKGELITTYKSLHKAADAIGKKWGYKKISKCCNGRIKEVYGYIWKFI